MGFENKMENDSASRAQRIQNLQSMERLVINMGGRKAYIKWLESLPDSADFNTAGGMTHQAMAEIAEDNYKYNELVSVFAETMQPVFALMQ